MASLKKNFIYQIAYQILIVILPLITSPYLARVLGAQGLGEYSYSYSIAYYFSLFILLGVNNHGTREIAKVRGDIRSVSERFWSIYTVQLVAGLCVIPIYVITQVVCVKDNTLALIQLLYILSAILDINWLFFGLEKFKTTVTRNFIVKIITVVSIFAFVRTESDVRIYTFIMAASFLVSQFAMWPFTRGYIYFTRPRAHEVLKNIKPLLVLFIPVVAASIFKYMDKIMLGAMYSKSELGLYDNAEKIMSIPTGLITAIGTVMLPRISKLITEADGEVTVKKYIRLSLSGSMMIASALTFGLAAISSTFAVWFWGEEFSKCGSLIKAIAVTILFLSWANVIRTQYLIPYNRESIFVRATIYGAIINLIINYLLIREYGAMGTVVGTVMAEFIVAFYQTVKCRKDLPIKKYIQDSVPYIVAGVIMYIAVFEVSKMNLTNLILLIIEIITGILIYVILILAYFVLIKKFSVKEIYRFISLRK